MKDGIVSYVNSTMKEVNDYCDDLYESMIDQEKDKVIKTVENLKRVLNDIKKTYNDEGHIKG
jgi:hypothetical protein